jgi:alpha-D-ribose 1-methylphosphonate 5-phosphate C-P lyase
MHVKLYEDIARFGHIATTYAYPVKVNGALRDGPVADAEIRQSEDAHVAALQLFGAGREKRIYAMPPYTGGQPRFRGPSLRAPAQGLPCALCGAEDSISTRSSLDDKGGRMFVCSDTDHCENAAITGASRQRECCALCGERKCLM